MIKSIYFSIALSIFSLPIFIGAEQEQISLTNQSTDAQLTHITQEKKAIIVEMKLAIKAYERAISYFQNALKDLYIPQRQKCIELLAKILASPEFTTTVEQVTDQQVNLIIEKNVYFNDILMDPSAFPLEEFTKKELLIASFDETTEQLFNVLYLLMTIIRGSQLLLTKLEVQEKLLTPYLQPNNSLGLPSHQ